MKKIALIFAGVVLAGCALDRQDDFDVDYALEFQPAMYMHVSADGAECFPEDQSFAVRAWTLPEKNSWKDDAAKAEEFLQLTEAKHVDSAKTWGFEEPVMWPSKHERLTFYAYSPVEAGDGCDVATGISFLGVDVKADQTDLLYVDSVTDLDKMECGGIVVLPFRHALSSMSFKVKNRVQKQEQIIIRKITLESANYKGDFRSLATPQWALTDDKDQFVFFEGEQQSAQLPAEIGQMYWMVPQTLDTQVTVQWDFITEYGGYLTQKLSTVKMKTELKPGMNYTFTLSVGIDDVKFLVEIIENSLGI